MTRAERIDKLDKALQVMYEQRDLFWDAVGDVEAILGCALEDIDASSDQELDAADLIERVALYWEDEKR